MLQKRRFCSDFLFSKLSKDICVLSPLIIEHLLGICDYLPGIKLVKPHNLSLDIPIGKRELHPVAVKLCSRLKNLCRTALSTITKTKKFYTELKQKRLGNAEPL